MSSLSNKTAVLVFDRGYYCRRCSIRRVQSRGSDPL